jgi:site-specific DNA recombinase
MATRPRGPGTRAATYARISRDAEGLALGVERQREDIDEYACRVGLEIVARFEDNDIGASTRSRKPRPEYKLMLSEAAAGRFDVIVAYTSSRLTRRPRENEDLIDLAERHGIRFLYRNSPSFDLNTADGRNVARILAANDAAESERIGERVARKSQERAKNGEWHGGWPPCGYRFTYDSENPLKVIGMKLDPDRAPVVEEMSQRVLDGESLYALCRDLNTRDPFISTPPGARARAGAMWRSRTLKRALINPAVAGLREHDGDHYRGTWPAILDRETWNRVRDVLTNPWRTDPNRVWVADTTRKRALSGLLVCGATRTEGPSAGERCGATLVSQPLKGVPSMICSRQATGGCGHLRINYEPVERLVTRLLIARLDGPDMLRALVAKNKDSDAEVATLRLEVAADRRRLRDLEDKLVDDLLSEAAYRRQRDRLSARIDAARSKLAQLVGQRSEVSDGADLAARLAQSSIERQRALLCTFVGAITISPQPHGVPTHVTKRKAETDGEYLARLTALRESTLARRVKIEWRSL